MKLRAKFCFLFFKIDKKKSEIIISSSFHVRKKIKIFQNFILRLRKILLPDVKRLYTLGIYQKSLRDIEASVLDIGCCKGGSGFVQDEF